MDYVVNKTRGWQEINGRNGRQNNMKMKNALSS